MMLIKSITALRVLVGLVWLTGIVALLGITALPHLLPPLDRQMYIVRGASMQPAIPLGAIVVVREVDSAAINVGDVVTFRVASGTIITHRVVSVASGGQPALQTKGDASATADPVVVPVSSVIGRVEHTVPLAGLVLTAVGTPPGALAVLGMLGGLLLMGWFMDELIATARRGSAQRVVAETAA